MNRVTQMVKPGGIRYETTLGPLFLDTLLDESTVDRIIVAMALRKLTPFEIVGATISDDDISFQLREPFTSD